MKTQTTKDFIDEKCMKFSVRTVNLYKYLTQSKQEYVLSKQLLRSGTSIGANMTEAHSAMSDRDFLFKVYISLKEANESHYWLQLLHNTEFLSDTEYNSIIKDCEELIKILTVITKKVNKRLNNDVPSPNPDI